MFKRYAFHLSFQCYSIIFRILSCSTISSRRTASWELGMFGYLKNRPYVLNVSLKLASLVRYCRRASGCSQWSFWTSVLCVHSRGSRAAISERSGKSDVRNGGWVHCGTQGQICASPSCWCPEESKFGYSISGLDNLTLACWHDLMLPMKITTTGLEDLSNYWSLKLLYKTFTVLL